MRAALFVVFCAWIDPALASAQTSLPVVQNERPVRFVLTGGAVIEGTQISEDAEFYTVQTAQGLVRIRKTDLARIELQPAPSTPAAPAATTAAPAAERAPDPVPAPHEESDGGGGDGGGDLFLQGLGIFGLSYGITALVGALIAIGDLDGNLLFIPVVGPILWASETHVTNNDWIYIVLDSVCQGAGLGMMLIGLATWDSDDVARLGVRPYATREGGGVAAVGRF